MASCRTCTRCVTVFLNSCSIRALLDAVPSGRGGAMASAMIPRTFWVASVTSVVVRLAIMPLTQQLLLKGMPSMIETLVCVPSTTRGLSMRPSPAQRPATCRGPPHLRHRLVVLVELPTQHDLKRVAEWDVHHLLLRLKEHHRPTLTRQVLPAPA